LSYTQMAHCHLQRMLREGMELAEVQQDSDGDYPLRHGTAVYYLSVGPGGHMVKIWSNVVLARIHRSAWLDGPVVKARCPCAVAE